ncbi:hypothetical protein AKJ65_06830 [candidate division MSBL1 archaeon SCGC-AAA259E19]|uniref:PIN domain-containing protein n=1 Tax=candidate division MSBL1 archaeon SCGC-AAA259E19 TaxID=1698264 RepID=A0A133UFI9_9EURY|nr:hypothetical protein AKJ65_06830 [candidate division MSBL1 archaeon SCGC-AAA259E19]
MTKLLDASAVVKFILEDEDVGVERIFDNQVLDLTFYEAGNSFWKAAALQDRISEDDAEDAANILDDLREEVEVIRVKNLNLEKIMEIALEEEITYYDSSYIAGAEEKDAPLVTQDGELSKNAEKYVEVEKID